MPIRAGVRSNAAFERRDGNHQVKLESLLNQIATAAKDAVKRARAANLASKPLRVAWSLPLARSRHIRLPRESRDSWTVLEGEKRPHGKRRTVMLGNDGAIYEQVSDSVIRRLRLEDLDRVELRQIKYGLDRLGT